MFKGWHRSEFGLTGNVRLRRTWRGRYVFQVEVRMGVVYTLESFTVFGLKWRDANDTDIAVLRTEFGYERLCQINADT